jgi:hypothetical protein
MAQPVQVLNEPIAEAQRLDRLQRTYRVGTPEARNPSADRKPPIARHHPDLAPGDALWFVRSTGTDPTWDLARFINGGTDDLTHMRTPAARGEDRMPGVADRRWLPSCSPPDIASRATTRERTTSQQARTASSARFCGTRSMKQEVVDVTGASAGSVAPQHRRGGGGLKRLSATSIRRMAECQSSAPRLERRSGPMKEREGA